MTVFPPSSTPSTPPATPPAHPGGLFTGPSNAGLRLALGALIGALATGFALTLALAAFSGVGPRLLTAAGAGAGMGFLAPLAALLALRPWNPRPEARWPFALLGAQAFSALLVPALDGLVYFSALHPHLDPLPLALTSAGGFIGAWVGQIRVFSALLKARHAPRPAVGSEP